MNGPHSKEEFSIRNQFQGYPVLPADGEAVPVSGAAVGASSAPGSPAFQAPGGSPELSPEMPPIRRAIAPENFIKTLDFAKILRGFMAAKWIILVVFVAFGGLGILAGRKLGGTTWDSSATLLYTPMPKELAGLVNRIEIQNLTKQTAIEMIHLPQTREEVSERLGWPGGPEALASKIEVTSDKRNDLVIIAAVADKEADSVALANAMARAAVLINSRWYKDQIQGMHDRLEGRLREGADTLRELKEQKAALGMDNQVFDPQSEYAAYLDRMALAQQAFATQEASVQSQSVRIESLQALLEELPAEVMSTAYEDNPLKRRLANTEVALMEARTRYGPENPNTLMIVEEIKELRRMIDEGSFDSSREQVFMKNPLREQLSAEIIRLKADEEASKSTLELLRVGVTALEKAYSGLPEKLRKFAQLSQRIESLETSSQAQQTILKDLAYQLNQELGDFEVLVYAEKAVANRSKMAVIVKVFGFMFGLGVAVSFVLVFQVLDDRLFTVRQIGAFYDAPVAVVIPDYSRRCGLDPEAVQLHIGRSWMSFEERLTASRQKGRIFGFFSDEPGVGRSTITAALASYFRGQGQRVLCLDFCGGGGGGDGLERLIESGASWEEVVRSGEHGDEAALGRPVPGLMEWVRSPAWPGLCAEVRKRYDTVLLRGPAVNHEMAALPLARSCDHFLMVVCSGKTRRGSFNPALEQIRASGERPCGLVLNRLDPAYLDGPTLRRLARKRGAWLRLPRWAGLKKRFRPWRRGGSGAGSGTA